MPRISPPVDPAPVPPAAARAADGAHALTESQRDGYSVVKVFYATDRKPLADTAGPPQIDVTRLVNASIVLVAGLLLAGLLRLGSRRKLAVAVLLVGVIAAGTMAGREGLEQWQSPGDRERQVRYGGQRGALQLGTCEVSIPQDHRVGELEAPTIWRLQVRQQADKHIVLLSVSPQSDEQFYSELRETISRSGQKETFVFVHGYNVSFENAARRTAQIAYDLNFDGAPILYSWPSQASVLKYPVDENNVTWTVPHLKKFLIGVANNSGAHSIHLVAHSMGNRALTTALRELHLELNDHARLFNQIVLAAPDIDAEVFRRDIAPAILKTANRVTLYASSNDQALIASKTVHGYARAGDSGDGLVVIPGIETVDVSSIDTSLLGHSYYGSNDSIIADMYHLLREKLSAQQRRWLRPALRDGLMYFIFDPQNPLIGSHTDQPQTR